MLGAPRKIVQHSNDGLHLPKHERLHKGERKGERREKGKSPELEDFGKWFSSKHPMRLLRLSQVCEGLDFGQPGIAAARRNSTSCGPRLRAMAQAGNMDHGSQAAEMPRDQASKLLQHGSKAWGELIEVIGLEGKSTLKIIDTGAAGAACRLKSSSDCELTDPFQCRGSVAVLHLPRSWRRPLLCRRFGIEQLAGILRSNLRKSVCCQRSEFARQTIQAIAHWKL